LSSVDEEEDERERKEEMEQLDEETRKEIERLKVEFAFKQAAEQVAETEKRRRTEAEAEADRRDEASGRHSYRIPQKKKAKVDEAAPAADATAKGKADDDERRAKTKDGGEAAAAEKKKKTATAATTTKTTTTKAAGQSQPRVRAAPASSRVANKRVLSFGEGEEEG
jgi:hypothetical protein